jgi:hypothetical protein
MSVRLNHEAFGTYETTNERKGTSYSTGSLTDKFRGFYG